MSDLARGRRPLELGFARNDLDRTGAEKGADGEGGGFLVPIVGEHAVLRAGDPAPTALHPEGALEGGEALARVFLGRRGGAAVHAVLLPGDRLDAFRADPGLLVSDLRTIAVARTVEPGELGALAQAKSLLHWHARHGFCAHCGAATAPASAGLRRDCPACGTQHFPRTDPVAIMLVHRGERCLLGRQARFPPGTYSCLAGFVSPGESIEDAVRRETLEEAGVPVGAVRYLLSQPWPFPSSLMIGCLAEGLGDALALDREELEDGRWFSRDEAAAMLERRHPDGLGTPPPMAIAHHLIRAWVEGATADA